jgi:hypothetical protein
MTFIVVVFLIKWKHGRMLPTHIGLLEPKLIFNIQYSVEFKIFQTEFLEHDMSTVSYIQSHVLEGTYAL